jgi:hypothetical protein
MSGRRSSACAASANGVRHSSAPDLSVMHVLVRIDELQQSAGARLHVLHLLLVACGAQRNGNDSVVVAPLP